MIHSKTIGVLVSMYLTKQEGPICVESDFESISLLICFS
jgi:hypothetical protein